MIIGVTCIDGQSYVMCLTRVLKIASGMTLNQHVHSGYKSPILFLLLEGRIHCSAEYLESGDAAEHKPHPS